MKRVFKLTDPAVSSAERVYPDDDLTVLAPGVRVRFQGRIWTVLMVDPSRDLIQMEN